jgi:cytoskeletal protein RodZ
MEADKKHTPEEVTRQQMLDYIAGKLTSEEKNLVERSLMADKFGEDALEGLSQSTESSIKDDLEALSYRIRNEEKAKPLQSLMRIAAIALMMIVPAALIWMLISIPKSPEIVTQTLTLPTVPDSATKTEIPVNTSKEPQKQELQPTSTTPKAVSRSPKKEQEVIDIKSIDEIPIESNAIVQIQPIDTLQVAKLEEKPDIHDVRVTLSGAVTSVEVKKKASAPVVIRGLASTRNLRGKVTDESGEALPGATVRVKGTTTGTITDAEGNFTLPVSVNEKNTEITAGFIGFNDITQPIIADSFANIALKPNLVAMNEVVVVAYGTQTSEEETSPYMIAPKPRIGYSRYQKYLSESAKYPLDGTGKIEVVKIQLFIDTSGSIANIEILSSPGKSYSDEAIRVVKEGPGWRAATQNGNTINGSATIKVTFKPLKL